MTGRKLFAGICTVALTISLATGCGNSGEKSEDSTKIVQVTQIEGSTVTAQVGTLTEGQKPEGRPPSESGGQKSDGTPPEQPAEGDNGKPADKGQKPDGTPPAQPGGEDNKQSSGNGQKPEGTPPAKPEGEAGDSSQGGDGKASQGQPPQGAPGGSSFEAGEDTITFQLQDSTKIILEQLQGEAEGKTEDIVKGAVLEITLDKDNNATKIIVRNLRAGSGFGGSETPSNGTAAETLDADAEISGKTYESSGDDENALRVDGSSVVLKDSTVRKTGGKSSNTENGDFYGANAGLLATNGATVTISGTEVSTDAVNGNGIFSYGEGTTVNVSDTKIRTTKNNSGGIQTTGGGTMNAANLDVATKGNSAAAIRSDRGGGTVTVDGGTYVTGGTGSPAVYSTADITVKNASLKAEASEGVVVEGKNSVTLENCDVVSEMKGTYNGDSSENIHGIMIYQSMSGDADVGEAGFSAKSGSITAKVGDLFYVTNTDCKIALEDVNLKPANDTLLRVEGNDSSRGWGTEGANGGDVTLTAVNQKLEGNIIVDKISSLDMTLSGNTQWNGAVNSDGEAGTVNVVLKEQAVWNLTADSYVSQFDGDTSQIKANGHHLYVKGKKLI